jgi:hypothetical protein
VLGWGDWRWLSAIMGHALAYCRAPMSFLPWLKSPAASVGEADFASGAFAAGGFASPVLGTRYKSKKAPAAMPRMSPPKGSLTPERA